MRLFMTLFTMGFSLIVTSGLVILYTRIAEQSYEHIGVRLIATETTLLGALIILVIPLTTKEFYSTENILMFGLRILFASIIIYFAILANPIKGIMDGISEYESIANEEFITLDGVVMNTEVVKASKYKFVQNVEFEGFNGDVVEFGLNVDDEDHFKMHVGNKYRVQLTEKLHIYIRGWELIDKE